MTAMGREGFSFEVLATRGKARAGLLRTPRGDIPTPVFMPVGTLGTVKGLTPGDLESDPLGAHIILGNTYHLYLRPGLEVIEAHGGLHGFCGWHKPILTDSGGFQVFSLSDRASIDEDGVTFRSPINGDQHRLTPERSMEIQRVLGSDIVMAFDHCPAGDAPAEVHEAAMARTTRWARRCRDFELGSAQVLFGIVQGGTDLERRHRHLEELVPMEFDGYAIGGLSVGEGPEEMARVLRGFADKLPADRPRYLMGVGTPDDLHCGVTAGVDMFDCVMPTRNARTGTLFTSGGRVNIKAAAHKADTGPLDRDCPCLTCTKFSRSYLRHLYICREMLYGRLATLHNLTFYSRHMARMRAAILAGRDPEPPILSDAASRP